MGHLLCVCVRTLGTAGKDEGLAGITWFEV